MTKTSADSAKSSPAHRSAAWLHASIPVDDIDMATRFLDAVLGFKVSFGPVELGDAFARLTGTGLTGARLIQLSRGKEVIELIETGAGVSGWAHIAFCVPDLDAALGLSQSAGGSLVGEVVRFAEGRSAYVRSPGGALVELEELF